MAFASTQPYYVFSQQTFFSELAQLEGGENAITSSTAAYPEVSLENIILNNPEHIFVADSIHYFNILHQKQLQKLKAVQQKKIHCIPTDILSRPGSRMDSLRWWIHQSISNE
jgi:vitamin B12 transport system substrate-binding protein